MSGVESKSLALLRILNVLEKYSDVDHPLTQQQIIDYLERDYGISIERKNVARKLSVLKEALSNDGIELESNPRTGVYLLTRKIENYELRMLIDGVLSSRYITADCTDELIKKLCSLSNVYFKAHVKNIQSFKDWPKTDNKGVYLNIELVDEAILRKKQLTFKFNAYGTDKKLHPTSSQQVSPYQMLLHNQQYYLMAKNEKWGDVTYYRLDHITDMQIVEDSVAADIRSIPGFKNGIDYRDLATARPYLFNDRADAVTFLCEAWVIDQVIERFGNNFTVFKADEGKLKITVRASKKAMEYWAMQYLNHVEILSPLSLRETIRQNVINAAEKYK